jgi:translation initiation factor 1A
MGKRKSKGQKRKIRKEPTNRELVYKDDGQEYAKVLKMLGNGRCELQCIDGIVRLGNIRGAMRHKIWIKLSDFVLVGLREYQDEKCDIIAKYSTDEVRALRSYGEIPTSFSVLDSQLEEEKEQEDETVPFDFDDI